MAITETTEFQWNRIEEGDLKWLLAEKTSSHNSEHDLPATDMTWEEAANFCATLTSTLQEAGKLPEGYIIRLPSEAEWEWACRREHESLFPFGDSPEELGIEFGQRARFLDNGNDSPGPVGAKTAGQAGLKGLYGNVREWCLDWEHTYSGLPETDPVFLATTSPTPKKATRGGDFATEAQLCTGTVRTFADPTQGTARIGFRIVLGLPLDSFESATEE